MRIALVPISLVMVTCSDMGAMMRDAGQILVDAGNVVGERDAGAQTSAMRFEATCSTTIVEGASTIYYSDIQIPGLDPSKISNVFVLGCGLRRTSTSFFGSKDCGQILPEIEPGLLRIICGTSGAGSEGRYTRATAMISM